MADDGTGGGLTVPTTDNWGEWTFEQALKALTGEGADLHGPAKASWFTFNPSPGAGDEISYHAWGDYYYGANVNHDAVNTWNAAINTIDEMMPDVARGQRGGMDLQSVKDLQTSIANVATWVNTFGQGSNQWATRLDSDEDSFRGKAAFLIYWRLKAQGDGLTDTYQQLTSRHGRPIADVVGDAATELGNFNSSMSNAWSGAVGTLRNLVANAINGVINDISNYIDNNGLQLGLPGYKLDAFAGDIDSGKAFIRETLQKYPGGDLTSEAGWQQMNDKISNDILAQLKTLLDTPAQGAIGALAPKYTLATSSLIEITPPPTETPPQPDTKTNTPPDGNANGNVTPPDGGANGPGGGLTPPDGGANGPGGGLTPPDGGANGPGGGLTPPGGGANGPGGGVTPPGGGANGPGGGLTPPDGGANGPGGGLTPPGGGANGGPGGQNLTGGGGNGTPAGGGAFAPGLVPPGGGIGNGANGGKGGKGVGPGGDGSFNQNPGGNGVIKPPNGGKGAPGNSLPPPGSGKLTTHIPAGGSANGGFGTDPGKGFGSGAGLGGANGGVGAGAGGLGTGLGGAGLGGLGGGPGGGLTGLPSQLTGGSPGMPGAPSSGDGGVPFFPPMMGGAGAAAGGEKPQERERQTWLSEDEEIWGTRVDVGSGVIGRLEEEEYEVEEIPLVGPRRRPQRVDRPRRPRTEEQREEAAREATAGEEATGSA